MNSRISHRHRRAQGLLLGRPRGQGLLELAYTLPIMALMLVIASDFARVFFFSIAVNNAARAGAQYGSQTLTSAADTIGIKNAAKADGTNVPGLSASATQCTCENPRGSVTACATSYCTANAGATFVIVNTTATYTTLLNYPGINHSYALSGQAIMQVQQ